MDFEPHEFGHLADGGNVDLGPDGVFEFGQICYLDSIKIANDGEILDSEGKESEALGISKCKSLFGLDTTWKQTWFGENPKRCRTAIVDGEYIPEHDVFVRRKPFVP